MAKKKLKSVEPGFVNNEREPNVTKLKYETTIAGFGSPTIFKGTKIIQDEKIISMNGWVPSSTKQIAETRLVHVAQYDNGLSPITIFSSSATNLISMIEQGDK